MKLYHGSSVYGLKTLKPFMKSKRYNQKKPRVYAVTKVEEAAVFACPFYDDSSKISWHGGKMHVRIKDQKLIKKYNVSVYEIDSKYFSSVDESNLEWYSEKPVKVLNEIVIEDALEYTKKNGITIEVQPLIFNSLIPELAVTNYKKSLNFYTKILGFKLEYSREDEGFAFLSLAKAQLMIDEIGKGRTWKSGKLEKPLGRGINIQIQINNVLLLINKLKENNIKLFLDVEEKWYEVDGRLLGNKQFLVQDPDGYLLRFFEDLGIKKSK